jgi:hypothetical protein
MYIFPPTCDTFNTEQLCNIHYHISEYTFYFHSYGNIARIYK